MNELKGVKIGDRFRIGRFTICTVVDFYEIKSMTTGETIGHQCIVVGSGHATNRFDVPFATVLRKKIVDL